MSQYLVAIHLSDNFNPSADGNRETGRSLIFRRMEIGKRPVCPRFCLLGFACSVLLLRAGF